MSSRLCFLICKLKRILPTSVSGINTLELPLKLCSLVHLDVKDLGSTCDSVISFDLWQVSQDPELIFCLQMKTIAAHLTGFF